MLSIFTPRKRRLLVLLGGTLVADRQQHFLLIGSGLARLLAFRRLEIRRDTNVSHQSHCHNGMRRRVAVVPCQIVVQAHFPTRITYRHGDDHRSRGRCPLRGRRNDRVGRRTRQQHDLLPHKRYLSQRQEGSHRQAIPGPFCLQVSARLHSGHPGPGIAPEKNPGTRAPSSATARLQRLPWSSTLALPRSEF